MTQSNGVDTLRQALLASLRTVNEQDLNDIVEVVLRTLDQQRVIEYAPKGDLPLLSTHGRTLVAILENPGITQRALAVYLGTSENNLQKSVKALENRGLIAMTKVGKTRTYSFDTKTAFQHSDITRFFDAIAGAVKNEFLAAENASDIHDEPAF